MYITTTEKLGVTINKAKNLDILGNLKISPGHKLA
jgi:hypothetical protein